ncbi:MAG: hypothetical protein BMS9Abin29_1612 [Gemmatimonadota bacterium]|nr:MAG: hypothetical protein BMS9Abin29_1612 [Gemmatimonadota bacterium]
MGLAACRPSALPEPGFWTISCDRPSDAGDTLEVTVVVDSLGAATPSELLVRLDSLRSAEGPDFDLQSGFIAQVFLRTGAGRGCANTGPAGVELWAPGDQLTRTWIHLKSDGPASVTVVRGDGSLVTGPVIAEVNQVVPLIRWGDRQ